MQTLHTWAQEITDLLTQNGFTEVAEKIKDLDDNGGFMVTVEGMGDQINKLLHTNGYTMGWANPLTLLFSNEPARRKGLAFVFDDEKEEGDPYYYIRLVDLDY